jgi:hypothetical protein
VHQAAPEHHGRSPGGAANRFGGLRSYRMRSRRPDAPPLPNTDVARAELGADRDGVGVALAETGHHQIGAGKVGEPPQTQLRGCLPGQRQVR